LARLFDEAFADEKPHPAVRYADYVVSDTGGDDTRDGMTKIRAFKKEKYPQILVSVNMLDTGFDLPELQNLVFARYTKSAILYRQMRGRGARKAPGKALFTMFDFVGVTDMHEGDDRPVAKGGAVRVSEPRPRPQQPRRCWRWTSTIRSIPTTRAWLTMDADGNLVQPEATEALAQAIGARFESWLLPREAQFNPEQAPLAALDRQYAARQCRTRWTNSPPITWISSSPSRRWVARPRRFACSAARWRWKLCCPA
jgi:type I restriction enzyme R subunit